MIYPRSLIVSSILLYVVFTTSLVYSADITQKDNYSKPDRIISEIKLRGARAIVRELTKDWDVWDFICDKIATGDQAWLKAAIVLQGGTDAGSSETLDLALGEALENDSENVFRFGGKNLDLEFVCNGPDVDNPRYNSYVLSINAINLRINKVAAGKDPMLQKMRTECLGYLENSKKGIAQFYEVENK
jgi:hypothetical protein